MGFFKAVLLTGVFAAGIVMTGCVPQIATVGVALVSAAPTIIGSIDAVEGARTDIKAARGRRAKLRAAREAYCDNEDVRNMARADLVALVVAAGVAPEAAAAWAALAGAAGAGFCATREGGPL